MERKLLVPYPPSSWISFTLAVFTSTALLRVSIVAFDHRPSSYLTRYKQSLHPPSKPLSSASRRGKLLSYRIYYSIVDLSEQVVKMATWSDYLSLGVTLLLFAGAAYFVSYIYGQLMETKQWSKEKLQRKGVNISHSGVSVKRKTKLANREEYFDATQRKVIKALNSARYGPGTDGSMHDGSPRSSFESIAHDHKRSDSVEKRKGWRGLVGH